MKIEKNSDEAILIKDAILKYANFLDEDIKGKIEELLRYKDFKEIENIIVLYNEKIDKLNNILYEIYEEPKFCEDDIPF